MTTTRMQPGTANYLRALSKRIQRYRLGKGLKQSALAAAIGCSSSTISGAEVNPLAISERTIRRLAETIPEFSSAYADYVATFQDLNQPPPPLTPDQRELIGRIKELLDELLANG